MSFPAELNAAAIKQLFAFTTGTDRDTGRAVLAVYEVAGFALGRFFGTAGYLTGDQLVQSDPLLTQVQAEFESAGADHPKLRELIEKYGPALLQLALKLLLK